MGYTAEGTIEIELADFWEFAAQYLPVTGETVYGVPRIIKVNRTIEINFATSSYGSPADWAKTPEASKQWET
ncbi:MAG: hypothetical protein AB7V04_07095 [Desulfomonilaceae bacterium]